MSIIKVDLGDYVSAPATCIRDDIGKGLVECGRVDDLIIGFKVGPIDGVRGVLGHAGYQTRRNTGFSAGNYLPVSGMMT